MAPSKKDQTSSDAKTDQTVKAGHDMPSPLRETEKKADGSSPSEVEKETESSEQKASVQPLSEDQLRTKSLEDEISKLNEQLKSQKDKLLRTHADYQNYRKRHEEDLKKRADQGRFDILSDLLPVIDQLYLINEQRASEHKTDPEVDSKYLGTLQRRLEELGLRKISTLGQPIDLKYHEVIKSIGVENGELDSLVESEIQSGFIYKDRVLRAALVTVGKKKETTGAIKQDEGREGSDDEKSV